MNLDKMKPDLKSLNLEKLKREMSEHMPRVREKMTPRRWIALVAGLAVVGGALPLAAAAPRTGRAARGGR